MEKAEREKDSKMAQHSQSLLTTMFVVCMIGIISAATPSDAATLALGIARHAGHASGEPLVKPDCANSSLKIVPCQRVARSWLEHLNSRAQAFVQAYRAVGYRDEITEIVLDCSTGIYSDRKARSGVRNSRHAYAEACDGNSVRVNSVTFRYRRAVTHKDSPDRKFFVQLLDAWGEIGPGCIPQKGYAVSGVELSCRPILVDNCGVIDWRERGAKSQYGHTYHLSYCYYSDPERAYE